MTNISTNSKCNNISHSRFIASRNGLLRVVCRAISLVHATFKTCKVQLTLRSRILTQCLTSMRANLSLLHTLLTPLVIFFGLSAAKYSSYSVLNILSLVVFIMEHKIIKWSSYWLLPLRKFCHRDSIIDKLQYAYTEKCMISGTLNNTHSVCFVINKPLHRSERQRDRLRG